MKRKSAGQTASADLKAAMQALGYEFADESLLANALTHVSALKVTTRRADSYQRLEFLGDHVLGLVVSDILYRAFPDADEGELSKRLADLVRAETCADIARGIGLDAVVKVGGVSAAAGERLRRSILGDVCEAAIGAIYLDGGHAAAAEVVGRLWSSRLRKPMKALRDSKTVLQEWAQGRGLPTPVYREVDRSGPHHNPHFRIAVELPGLAPAEGTGGSKRAAEKAAATVMLEREGVLGAISDV